MTQDYDASRARPHAAADVAQPELGPEAEALWCGESRHMASFRLHETPAGVTGRPKGGGDLLALLALGAAGDVLEGERCDDDLIDPGVVAELMASIAAGAAEAADAPTEAHRVATAGSASCRRRRSARLRMAVRRRS